MKILFCTKINMGICGSNEEKGSVVNDAPSKSAKRTLAFYGDLIDPDTRTLIVAFSLSGVKNQFNEINTLGGEHLKESYLKRNPLGSVPCIIEDKKIVFGRIEVFLNYLHESKPRLSKYCPQNEAEMRLSH